MITIYLSKLLSERHMTQADLARLTGIRPSTICDLCNNNASFIKLQHLDLICQKLGCNVDDIISFKSIIEN